MRRPGSTARSFLAIVVAATAIATGVSPSRAAEATPDQSEVVLVLDFSASILRDETNRTRFAAALERIADRVDEQSADLVASDTTVSLVQFAATARDTPGCVELELLDSPDAVETFSECLRSVAEAYRTGLDPDLTADIGIDTNYVAAMQRAARHLPADAERPTLILFTDGQHDVDGVPVSEVAPAREELFGDRSPFALLPVGMGLESGDREELTAGLEDLRITRDMPPCVSGTTFDWSQVVFETAEEAGNAVAVALQAATCTFTVPPSEPPPSESPSPTPPPAPGDVRNIELTAGDEAIELAWTPPAEGADEITDYRARCTPEGGDPVESGEGVSLEPRATVEGLTEGTAYACEVAIVTADGDGEWTSAAAPVTPMGIPAAPGKPAVVPLDGGVEITISEPAAGIIEGYRYECSSDAGATWTETAEVASPDLRTTRMGDLSNGTDYVCRTFASNTAGVSDASPLSDIVRPCAGLFGCNPLALPVLSSLVALAAVGILVVLFLLYRERNQGYVLAVMDVVHTANLGKGSKLGIELTRAPGSKAVTGILSQRGPAADFQIRALGGNRFAVTDKVRRQDVSSGQSLIVVDSIGIKHELTLRAFETRAASAVARRR